MKNVNIDIAVQEFSLLGGPLHRLGCRLGLVREGTNTFRLGVVLGLSAWAVLIILALLQGSGHKVFSLTIIGIHVRLLLAIPLFFLCETVVIPRMAEFVRNIVISGIVPRNSLPALKSEIARVARWKDYWLPEVICLLFAALLPLIVSQLHLSGATAVYNPVSSTESDAMAAWWYWFVCLPLFRFLMFRWFWHLGLWCSFLLRVARLELNLVPTHPDSAAGLGYLEIVQTHFTSLIFAISAVQSASFAEGLASGSMAFEAIYPALALILCLDALLFIGPLFIFSSRLWVCRVKGLSEYMEFAASYVNGFDRKWLHAETAPTEPLLGTPDLQSLADLGNSLSVIRNMRWVPLSARLATDLSMAALAPMLPLLLMKYPVAELMDKFFTRLIGL
jgi:hypothetical protein